MLPRHGGVNGCRRGFYLRSGTQRRERGCPLHRLPVRAGAALPQGCQELGRTGTFSKCSQREPGFPINLVTSQILLSSAEACLLVSLTLGCKIDF